MLVVVCVAPIEFVLKRNVFEGFISSEGWNQVGLVDQTRDGVYRVKVTFEHPLTCAQFLITVGAAFVARACSASTFAMALGVVGLAVVQRRGSNLYTFWHVDGIGCARRHFGFEVLDLDFDFSQPIDCGRVASSVTLVDVCVDWPGPVGLRTGQWSYGRRVDEFASADQHADAWHTGHSGWLDRGSRYRGGAKIAGFKGYFGVYFIDNIYLAYALDYGLLYCLVFMFILGFAIWRLCPTYEELRKPQANTGIRIGAALALAASACMLTMHATSALNEFILV